MNKGILSLRSVKITRHNFTPGICKNQLVEHYTQYIRKGVLQTTKNTRKKKATPGLEKLHSYVSGAPGRQCPFIPDYFIFLALRDF